MVNLLINAKRKGFFTAKHKLAVCAVALLSITGLSTTAAFTSTANTSINMASGSIDLYANTSGTNTKTATLDLGISKWTPGSSASKTYTLRNTGSIPIRVSLVTTSNGLTNSLGNKLQVFTSIDGTQVSAALLKNANFSNRTIPAGGMITVKMDVNWFVAANDNNFLNATDTIVFNFNGVA